LRLPLGEMAADKEKMLKELLVTLGERA